MPLDTITKQPELQTFVQPMTSYYEVKVFCSLKNNYVGTRIPYCEEALILFTRDMNKLVSQKKITKQDRGNYIDLFKQCVEKGCQERKISRADKVIPFAFRAVAAKVK